MNREIKFRGKCLNSNEWVEGFYVKNPDVPAGQNEHEVLISDGYECTPVVPATVGQFTGLRDKNGREIWEGDIVQYSLDLFDEMTVAEVRYSVEDARWLIVNDEEYIYEEYDCESTHNSIVIGNIHDNPELIKPNI